MATCPRCKGHLTETHRCPRRPRFGAAEVVAAGLGGGVAALLLVGLLDPGGQLIHLRAAAVALGVFAGIGLDRVIRG
jgi:hypothetical protein